MNPPAVSPSEHPVDSPRDPRAGSAAGIAGLDFATAQQRWSQENGQALKTPGAYEWWCFHTLSAAGVGVFVALFHGLPFDPHYVTQGPRSKHPGSLKDLPPGLSAGNYPAAYFAVYQGGQKVAQFLNVYPTDTMDSDSPDIRIGPNRITLRQDGSFGVVVKGYPFTVVRGRPRARTDQVLSAQLTFSPTFPSVPHSRPFRRRNKNGAAHHWVLAAPHGIMTGRAQLLDTHENLAVLDQKINSVGYHDHIYGHGSLAEGIHKQMWGFIQGDTWTAAWHQTFFKEGPNDHAAGLMFFEKDKKPVIVDGPASRNDHMQVGRWLMRYPGRLMMHGSDAQGHPVEMLIKHDGVLDTAPFHTRLNAQGSVTIPGRGSYQGAGATHVLQLRRLKWPVLSDVTLLAVKTVQQDDPLWSE